MTTKRAAPRAAEAPERHRNLPFVGLGLAAVVLAVVWWFAPAKAGELVTAFEILVGLIVGAAARRSLLSSDPNPPRLGYAAIASRPRPDGVARSEELVELERVVLNATSRTLSGQGRLRLLALELATTRLERLGVDARDSRAAAAALGPQLWEFVRSDRARPRDWYEPGIGLETIEAVVERLEQL